MHEDGIMGADEREEKSSKGHVTFVALVLEFPCM